MFLRSLQLSGFKTFARPTEIRFEGGVTAIVGPNGSGKTNIVDSFKWVFGAGQARDLRGKKMEEVIYAGGERRSRASFAEVTVVFDNTAGRLPVDYHEVAIKRRIERDGDSDYFLNGTRVRRRDLVHLLASTGLTVDSYAIIDQRNIESIVVSSPAERRALLEEAAQVRGVKARRQEAAQRLTELAQNLLRLEDLRGEIEPRLEVVRAQAAAAREVAEVNARLELLRGSIVWEEWRDARDSHRRVSSQAMSLERKLIEAREAAANAEAEFQTWRAEVQAAQDRRLGRQRALGAARLDLAEAEHFLQLAQERAQNQVQLVEALRREQGETQRSTGAAGALRRQLQAELEEGRASAAGVTEPSPLPEPPDASVLQTARREADQARRALAVGTSGLASQRTRREFLEAQLSHLEQMAEAATRIPAAEAEARTAGAAAAAAEQAAIAVARLTSELEGLEALRPAPGPGLFRLGDVLTADPGFERALSAVLGPLADAAVAPHAEAAEHAALSAENQVTVLYPAGDEGAGQGSLVEHVHCRDGFAILARRLLGHVVVGRDVTVEGVYRETGLVRGGADARVAIDARRRALRERIEALTPEARAAEAARERAGEAEQKLASLRSQSSGASRLDETRSQVESARAAEAGEAGRLPALEAAARAADEVAIAMARDHERISEAVDRYRSETQQAEVDRARWRDRVEELTRRLGTVEADLATLERSAIDQVARLDGAAGEAKAASDALPRRSAAVDAARQKLEEIQAESPEEEAELAEGARRLVALDETRIDARLKAGTMEGNLGLLTREAELLQARLDEIRLRMPDGVAPEEIPGGKGREKEMRALERRLGEIGPVNALAEAECRELEERFETLRTQLDDIAAAREDLEELIAKLREEEDARYEAVFGAVAANFQEYFSQLAPGGRATLRHAEGEEGPRSGVEILVQPPRKRLQNVTLLSSGERSLAALALVLALDEVNPSPFTILDEVDAALDDANVGRFGEMLSRLGSQRQFLVITHNHVTMSHASTLYGIHLDESGSSHLVSVRLEDIKKPAMRAGGLASEPQTNARAG